MFRSRMLAFKMAIPAGQAFPYRRGEVTEALSITLLILVGRVSVKQAALFDGFAFGPMHRLCPSRIRCIPDWSSVSQSRGVIHLTMNLELNGRLAAPTALGDGVILLAMAFMLG